MIWPQADSFLPGSTFFFRFFKETETSSHEWKPEETTAENRQGEMVKYTYEYTLLPFSVTYRTCFFFLINFLLESYA